MRKMARIEEIKNLTLWIAQFWRSWILILSINADTWKPLQKKGEGPLYIFATAVPQVQLTPGMPGLLSNCISWTILARIARGEEEEIYLLCFRKEESD